MEEDIYLLEELLIDMREMGFAKESLRYLYAIENLLKAYKEDEAVIEEMAGFIEVEELCDGTYDGCKHKEDIGSCKKCIIEYFRNKVKGEKE